MLQVPVIEKQEKMVLVLVLVESVSPVTRLLCLFFSTHFKQTSGVI